MRVNSTAGWTSCEIDTETLKMVPHRRVSRKGKPRTGTRKAERNIGLRSARCGISVTPELRSEFGPAGLAVETRNGNAVFDTRRERRFGRRRVNRTAGHVANCAVSRRRRNIFDVPHRRQTPYERRGCRSAHHADTERITRGPRIGRSRSAANGDCEVTVGVRIRAAVASATDNRESRDCDSRTSRQSPSPDHFPTPHGVLVC